MASMKVKRIPEKVLINVGALFDIPTCNFLTGEKGETIINGGIDTATGIIGPGNSFKSVIMNYLMLSGANSVYATEETTLHTYDTENNTKIERLRHLAERFPFLPKNVTDQDEGDWSITDKSLYHGDEWVNVLRDYVKEREGEKPVVWNGVKVGKDTLKAQVPSFVGLDSLTEFEPKSTTVMVSSSKAEDGSTNTLFMKQALFKTKFLAEMPSLMSKASIRFFTTAHLGSKIDMDAMASKYRKPTKALQYLKDGETIKGVSGKFNFLMSAVWFTSSVSILKNQATKLPEYPVGKDESNQATDLNLVRLQSIRNKSGASGIMLPIIISQTDGVLPTLTEFHFIKENARFGFEGNNVSYNIVFAPEVKIGRTTVRTKIENNPKLCRAINIASELLQLKIYHPAVMKTGLWCEPESLYRDLIEKGYDWDVLLGTRGWYTIHNYDEDLPPFLSIMDLLKMRKGLYHPFWMEKMK